MVAVEPEAETEEKTGDDEEPDGRRGAGGDCAGLVGLVDGGPGTCKLLVLKRSSGYRLIGRSLPTAFATSLDPWAMDIIIAETTWQYVQRCSTRMS